MKKYRLAFIFTFLLAVLAVTLLLKNHKGTLRKQENFFAVSDTSTITRFFLADKHNNTTKIARSDDGSWKLNDKYRASSDAVQIMLKTLLAVDVKEPVSKAARNTVIRMLAGKSVKIEVYQRVFRISLFGFLRLFPHEKCTRTYYVGDATMDNRGTYMLMEGSEEPYIVYIPGFRGFVATRYTALEEDWRDHSIFASKLPDIKSVSVRYSEKPEMSFIITNSENRNFSLASLTDNRPVTAFDTLKLIEYLGSFRRINFESFLNDMEKQKKDSITASTPTYLISLTDKSGKEYSLKAWRRRAAPGELDLEGKPTLWDRDRMYAQLGGSGDFVIIQYFVFDRLLAPITWFAKTGEQK